jgi:hypothetical protein
VKFRYLAAGIAAVALPLLMAPTASATEPTPPSCGTALSALVSAEADLAVAVKDDQHVTDTAATATAALETRTAEQATAQAALDNLPRTGPGLGVLVFTTAEVARLDAIVTGPFVDLARAKAVVIRAVLAAQVTLDTAVEATADAKATADEATAALVADQKVTADLASAVATARTAADTACTGPQGEPGPAGTPGRDGAYFANCDEAHDAGVAPIAAGEPGYRVGLDADRDGVACEDDDVVTPTTTPTPTAEPAAEPTATPTTVVVPSPASRGVTGTFTQVRTVPVGGIDTGV